MQDIKENETITIIKVIYQAMEYFFKDFYAFILGCLVSFIGYLLPVKNIVNLLVLFFILDVIFGFWAANTLRNERFSVKIIWKHTIPRMLISIILITGSFMWDKVYHQEFVSTYKIIGWFISGVLLYSIADNGYQITKWSVFTKIGNVFNTKIKDSTGLDINDKNE
jgi:Bacteriophage holin family